MTGQARLDYNDDTMNDDSALLKENRMPAALENDRFRLEIDVAGYEFPASVKDIFDANWLIFRVTLQSRFSAWRWQVEDAGALTWELDDCVNWLRALSSGEAVATDSWQFSEPDVSLDIIRGENGAPHGLTVNLMDEFQPPTKVLVPRKNNIVSLRFHAPPSTLRALADSLAESLARFPQRGARPVLGRPVER